MCQRSVYEIFKRATAWEIFPYDFTYRIADIFGRGDIFSVFLSKRTPHRPRICGNALCNACSISAFSAHHHGIQRVIGGKIDA